MKKASISSNGRPNSPEEALKALKKGNKEYVGDKANCEPKDQPERDKWLKHQEPWAIVLSCADSRVTPEFLFNTGIGDLFVIRVAGNVANTSSIASIEYAVANLPVQVIVVLGHESCGAVGAALKGGDNGYNLNHLLSHLNHAVSKTDDFQKCVQVNAKHQCKELVARSSIIGDAAKAGKIKIVPAYYNLAGKVDFK